MKGVRSFIGMVNYFRDFIKGLSSYMIPLTALTKKSSASETLRMTQKGRAAFALIKDLILNSSQLIIMNEEDLLILYTDASTRAIGGVLMQIQDGIDLCICLLCQDSCSLLVGQAFYDPNGPSQPCISCNFIRFQNWCVGE